MDQNNKPNRGITGYILLLLILLGILSMVSFYTGRRGGYTIQNMEEVLSSGLVEGARITPGQTPPTGSVELTLSNGGQMIVQVTDVAKAEEMLKEYKIYPVINKAEGEGILTTVILPLGVSMLVVMVVISIMNRGGGAGKMANFGKSRARLSLGDDSVTFDGVAGLKEEKEDLQEIVQFLKNPGKFIEVGARIPKGVPVQVRRCWQRRSQARQAYRFSLFPVRISWRCMSVSAHPVSGICSVKPKSMSPVSYLSMRLMRWQGSVVQAWAADTMKESRR